MYLGVAVATVTNGDRSRWFRDFDAIDHET